MAERLRFDETMKRVFEANLRCYEGLSRVTTDYIQALSRVWLDAGMSVFANRGAAPSSPGPPAPSTPPVSLVLEAEAGQIAQGVVMIENRLARRVSAAVVTSSFRRPEGGEIWPTLRVQPGTITLEPGARTLVQIAAVVDERLASGVKYRGEISVPGLSETPIPVVLQRSVSQEASASPAPKVDGTRAAKGPRRPRTSAGRQTRSS